MDEVIASMSPMGSSTDPSSPPERTHPYSVRFILTLGSNVELSFEDDEVRVPFGPGGLLAIRKLKELPKDEMRVSLDLEALPSAAEAERAGRLLAFSIMWRISRRPRREAVAASFPAPCTRAMATIKSISTPMSSDPRERRAIEENGPIFDTATNVPIELSVKTRRNQAANNVSFVLDPQLEALASELVLRLALQIDAGRRRDSQ